MLHCSLSLISGSNNAYIKHLLSLIDKLKADVHLRPKQHAIIVVGGVVGFCVVRYACWKLYNKVRAYPDGPLGLPFVGCLLSFGANPLQFLAYTGATYGALASFPLLLSNNVLISDPNVMRQLFKGEKMINRPAVSDRAMSGFHMLSGEPWETRRKFMMKTVISLSNTSFILSKVQETITNFIEPIMDKKCSSATGSSSLWDPHEFMSHVAFNNIWSLIFGVCLPLNDPFIAKFDKCIENIIFGLTVNFLLELMTNCSGPGRKGSMLRWLKWHVVHKYQHALDNLLIAWMNDNGFVVDSEKNVFRRSKARSNADQDTLFYVDVLIEQVASGQMSVEQVLSDMYVVLTGGTDTTARTSEYMFVLLAKYPKIQQMVYDELQSVIKKNSLKTFDFRILSELHIFRAFVHEGLRISSVIPMGVLHVAHRDVSIEVDGKQCVIPKGTALHQNAFYMNRYLDWNNNNQPLKEENNEIRLEYWLDDGKFKMNENFVGFGEGRRDCAGRAMAMKALYAIFGLMMCKYKFIAPNNDPQAIDIKQSMEIVLYIDPPICINIEKRL